MCGVWAAAVAETEVAGGGRGSRSASRRRRACPAGVSRKSAAIPPEDCTPSTACDWLWVLVWLGWRWLVAGGVWADSTM